MPLIRSLVDSRIFDLENVSIEASKTENQREKRLGEKKGTEYPRTGQHKRYNIPIQKIPE